MPCGQQAPEFPIGPAPGCCGTSILMPGHVATDGTPSCYSQRLLFDHWGATRPWGRVRPPGVAGDSHPALFGGFHQPDGGVSTREGACVRPGLGIRHRGCNGWLRGFPACNGDDDKHPHAFIVMAIQPVGCCGKEKPAADSKETDDGRGSTVQSVGSCSPVFCSVSFCVCS